LNNEVSVDRNANVTGPNGFETTPSTMSYS